MPKNTAEFNQLIVDVKKQFLADGQKVLIDITDIFTQWQQIRRELLVLDQDIFGRSVDDIEDQLDLMLLADFVYSRPAEIWQEYPRYLKALLLRLDRLPNNLQRDLAAIDDVDPGVGTLCLGIVDRHNLVEAGLGIGGERDGC